ncbi:c-type cytochrome [Halorientalis salina]|uniref:c-type cytochrome n=1 Tax=Halorientalis salina TaxID=2932266 RepID=UPI0010AD966C|nr:c-type cytochrome [Halorientalis salina]
MTGLTRRYVLATVLAVAIIALAGCGSAPTKDAFNDTASPGDGGGGAAAASGPGELPAQWNDTHVYDADLREGENKDDFRYRNATAGEEVQFVPKEMNESTLPSNPRERELVRYGREIMANTSEVMPDNVGNNLSCANCHGGGDLPTTQGMVGQDIDMIPLVGTAATYPEWTNRTTRMRDTRQRIMGCFMRSMNSPDSPEGMPEYTSREVQAMEAYMEWLGQGQPIGSSPYWQHLNKPTGDEKVPIPEVNPVRGAELYLENCASCHGADGQGVEGQYPPLWGNGSYNDGAGMGRIYTSAAFIREAMPYGYAHQVSDWRDVQDMAGYMNAHDRPHLQRQPQDWAETGSPDEAVYYNRTQERFGYDQNPMAHKLELAGIPTDDTELTESMIPDDVDRYDQPLRNETADNQNNIADAMDGGN